MDDWQDRVVAENVAVMDKIAKLSQYLTGTHREADDTARSLLRLQLATMLTYAEILQLRIKLF